MPTIALGRDQTLSVDGVTATGTRELDVSVSTQTRDLTHPSHRWTSQLVLRADVSVKILVYGTELASSLLAKFNQHPTSRVSLNISGIGTGYFVITDWSAKQPIDGVCSWEITLKNWAYT